MTDDEKKVVEWLSRAIDDWGKGDLDSVIRDYNEAIRLKPDDDLTYFNRGQVYAEKGDLDSAIRDYTEAIRLNPDFHGPYNYRGNAYADKGDLDSAIRDYTEAIHLNPDFALAYKNRGGARTVKGDLDSAIKDYTEAIRLKPDDAEAYHNRGFLRGDKGDSDGAIADYTEAIRLKPNDAYAYNNRGMVRNAKGDLDGAIQDFTISIRLAPNSIPYFYRAWARFDKGDLDGAIADYTEAIRISPDNADAYHNRGTARHAKGDLDGAKRDLAEASKLNPEKYTPTTTSVAYAPAFQAAKQTSSENKSVDDAPKDIEELFGELNALTGLERVKKEVRQLIQFVRIQNMRQQQGLGALNLSLHTVYYGSPGTGKTTVARIYGKMLKALGLLEKGHLVETDRAGLVANYVGQTANKTDEKINEAMGGVLFIDEAYSLYKSEQAAEWDYGSEAIEVLMKRMEDNRNNLAVIVAGYPEPMDKFLNSNEGFKSRFVNYIHFEDYTPAELTQIFVSFCNENNYSLTSDALQISKKVIENAYANKNKSFGNARYCRNLFEQIIRYQALRIGEASAIPSVSELKTILAQDVAPLLSS